MIVSFIATREVMLRVSFVVHAPLRKWPRVLCENRSGLLLRKDKGERVLQLPRVLVRNRPSRVAVGVQLKRQPTDPHHLAHAAPDRDCPFVIVAIQFAMI